jgi:hypothetical protein
MQASFTFTPKAIDLALLDNHFQTKHPIPNFGGLSTSWNNGLLSGVTIMDATTGDVMDITQANYNNIQNVITNYIGTV